MPLDGFSLLGFMDESFALNYLRAVCILTDTSDTALRGHWATAKAQLGTAISGAGQPDIQDIPPGHEAYLQAVTAHPRFNEPLFGVSGEFKLIEVDPLLSFQFHLEIPRSDALCSTVTGTPSIADMLPICLPHQFEDLPFAFVQSGDNFWITARSLNVRKLGPARIQNVSPQMNVFGLALGSISPLVQVVRFNGRSYLRNGYHRVYGLRRAGATHVPALFWNVTNPERIGLGEPGAAFDLSLLESADPPTCGHYTLGRAYSLRLRSATRVIHVSWYEHAVAEQI